jgi:phosphoribosylpyrophosphate synthetase
MRVGQVSACVTHALFSGPALERIGKSVMTNVIVSDTIPIRHNYQPGSDAEKVQTLVVCVHLQCRIW